MIDLLELIWRFLQAQPLENFLGLLPWHLMAVLAGMGILGGFGVHFLIGYVFRFYRRGARLTWWLSAPSLIVMLVLVQVLLGAYLLGSRAGALVSTNLTEDISDRMGRLLLQPMFGNPRIAALQTSEVGQGVLVATLARSTGAEYRASLQALIVPPGEISSQGNGEGAYADRILLQVGLRWVTAPHRTWLSPLHPAGNTPMTGDLPATTGDPVDTEDSSKSGDFTTNGADDIFLPDFLASLISELPPQAELSREDWEHVAGTRYVEGVLEPVMVEYLSYLSIALASLSGLLALLYLYLLRKVRGIGMKAASQALAKTDASARTRQQAQHQAPAPASEPPEDSTSVQPTESTGSSAASAASSPPVERPSAPENPEDSQEAEKKKKAERKEAARKEKVAKKDALKLEKAARKEQKKKAAAEKITAEKEAANRIAAKETAKVTIEPEEAPEDRILLEDPKKETVSAAEIISALPSKE